MPTQDYPELNSLIEPILGPLTGIECWRTLNRSWVLWLRALAPLPMAGVMLIFVWYWWFSHRLDPSSLPGSSLAVGLGVVEGMLVTVALILGPALLAGTLAGEKLRSTFTLLLAAQVSSREIVLARLVSRLCVVAVVISAGLPALLFFASLDALDLRGTSILLALPAAVAFGSSGLTMAVSATSRRGRDTLLLIYLVDLLFLLAPLLGGFALAARDWISPLNPYWGIVPLIEEDNPGPAVVTVCVWTLLGVLGCTLAAWRLRPASLADADAPPKRRALFGRGQIPPVSDRPLLWKELHVEHVQAFGRLVKWLGILIAAIFVIPCLAFAVTIGWATWVERNVETVDWARGGLSSWMHSSWAMVWLIQWAMGLRAAASIASERQQMTWDGLLTSPLEGKEILLAKIYGGVYALRAFIAVVLVSWGAAFACGVLTGDELVRLILQVLVIGVFMVVIGIRFSLSCQTANRAMTLTIIVWLAAACGFYASAGLLTAIAAVVVTTAWFLGKLAQGQTNPAGAPFGPWIGIFFYAVVLLHYALVALLVALYCRARFDRLAGRSYEAEMREKRPRNRLVTRLRLLTNPELK